MSTCAWKVGDVVTPDLEHSWVYVGTEWEDLMSKPRKGVVVEVPMSVTAQGHGTVLVQWESLTKTPLKRPLKWTSTGLVRRVAP